MHKSSLIPNDGGVFPLESDMQGNLPVSFGKGATEKGWWKAPRRCPTSDSSFYSDNGSRIVDSQQGRSPLNISTTRTYLPLIVKWAFFVLSVNYLGPALPHGRILP
jgi:hypothetical protein